MKYREEEGKKNTKQRQRQNTAAENKNGGKTIERLHPFTESFSFFLTSATCYQHKEKRPDVYEQNQHNIL
jgi:hypothetical protein